MPSFVYPFSLINLGLSSCWVAMLVAILWLWLVNDETNVTCFTSCSLWLNVVNQHYVIKLEHGEPPKKTVQPQYHMALVLAK